MIVVFIACVVLGIVIASVLLLRTERLWQTVLVMGAASFLITFGGVGVIDEYKKYTATAPSTVTVHFIESDRYVEYENAQYYSDTGKIVLEDGSTVQIVNAEIIEQKEGDIS